MAFAKIVETLVQLQSFLETQRSLLDADVFAQILQAQAKSILQQLGDFKGEVTPEEGNQFTQTVGQGGFPSAGLIVSGALAKVPSGAGFQKILLGQPAGENRAVLG